MRIYLLRHGIAEDGKPGRPDSERALTDEGRRRLRSVLERARAAGTAPGLILTSPYRRAVETAEIAADVLGSKEPLMRSEAFVPGASAVDAWTGIRDHTGEEAILVATHEPLMSSLAAYLLGCPALEVDVKKGTLLRIDMARLGAHPRGILKWMLTPALTKE